MLLYRKKRELLAISEKGISSLRALELRMTRFLKCSGFLNHSWMLRFFYRRMVLKEKLPALQSVLVIRTVASIIKKLLPRICRAHAQAKSRFLLQYPLLKPLLARARSGVIAAPLLFRFLEEIGKEGGSIKRLSRKPVIRGALGLIYRYSKPWQFGAIIAILVVPWHVATAVMVGLLFGAPYAVLVYGVIFILKYLFILGFGHWAVRSNR